MKTIEYNEHTNTFLVDEERVENSYYLIVLEHGSVLQVEKAVKERAEKLTRDLGR